MPELPDMMVVVEPEKNKEWEYKSASAMKIYNTYKKAGSFGFPTCQELASAIVSNISSVENNAIEKVTLAQAGQGDPTKAGFFLNIHLKKNFIESSIRNIYLADKVRLAGAEESKEESKEATKKQRVLVDFSSPNIAKNMHVGHLRSTI